MSAAASSSKATAPTEAAKEGTKEQGTVPTLGVLEEDDEFEEFPVQGECTRSLRSP
jgi:26 proteasome complex subunit DSS1